MILKNKEKFRLTNLVLTGFVLSLAAFVFLTGMTSAQTQIYDNGPFQTGTTTNSGVAAPAGAMWSEAQNPTGNTMEANSTAGISCSVASATATFRCGDDFTVPAGATWTINQVVVFAYLTGGGTTSPFTGATLRIWNGRPGDPGSAVIFGDTTTNRLGTSTDTNTFRVFNTVVGNGANPPTAPGTTRRIWRNAINVSPALALTAGTYWIDWNTSITPVGPHFAPPATVSGTRGLPGWNAVQSADGGTAYTAITDVGIAPTGAPTPPSVPQDFPFKLVGSISAPPTTTRVKFDFDGDGRADVSVFRPASNTWFINGSTSGQTSRVWGTSGDLLAPADYDNDGKFDVAVFRPSNGSWYILQSSTNTLLGLVWGASGDVPVPGDYNGDGNADVAVFRPSNGIWYIRNSGAGTALGIAWGQSGDTPVVGDYDGDGRADTAVFRPSTGVWYVLGTTAGSSSTQFGQSGDRPVPARYDTDARTDLAVFRPSEGRWYILSSVSNTASGTTFGTSSDVLVPADYDGDGRADIAVFRPSSGTWFVQGTTSGATSFIYGASTDTAIPSVYNP